MNAATDTARVLVVSPHFPPTNAPDMQRVRMVLPYLARVGIKAEILAIEPAQVAAPIDPWLLEGLPTDVPVHRVRAWSQAWRRWPGLGSLSGRARWPMGLAGDRLLASGRFDLIYFSTTQFALHQLGERWWRRYRIPFALDYQDPWVSEYQHQLGTTPPGGRLKYRISQQFYRRAEPRTLRVCSGLTSVSAAYIDAVRRRNSWLPANLPTRILPFPGDDRDLQRVRRSGIRQSVFTPNDGYRHWVYVGRGGADMSRAASALFGALAQARRTPGEQSIDAVRIHFIGTSYAAAGQGRPTLAPLADRFGVGDMVEERPDRIPFSMTLQCLLDADALFIVGSDDASYTASKLYPYLLAGKPLLGIFHEQSSAGNILRETKGGVVVTFNDSTTESELIERVHSRWCASRAFARTMPMDRTVFSKYSAENQAEHLAEFWRCCMQYRK